MQNLCNATPPLRQGSTGNTSVYPVCIIIASGTSSTTIYIISMLGTNNIISKKKSACVKEAVFCILGSILYFIAFSQFHMRNLTPPEDIMRYNTNTAAQQYTTYWNYLLLSANANSVRTCRNTAVQLYIRASCTPHRVIITHRVCLHPTGVRIVNKYFEQIKNIHIPVLVQVSSERTLFDLYRSTQTLL